MKYDFPHPREPKEINLAERLSRFGDDVLLIKASNQPGIKTPDCFWRNGYWELKTINKKANSQKNVFRLLKDAASQAPNIMFAPMPYVVWNNIMGKKRVLLLKVLAEVLIITPGSTLVYPAVYCGQLAMWGHVPRKILAIIFLGAKRWKNLHTVLVHINIVKETMII